MNSENYEKLYLQFNDSLTKSIYNGISPTEYLSKTLVISREFLKTLRAMVVEAPFPDENAEIYFFKHIKPKFFAQKIFQFELYGLDINVPIAIKDRLLDYYTKELAYIDHFLLLQAHFYHYYKTGSTEMDSVYFIRGVEVSRPNLPEIPDPDPLYSTSMDYLFARFIAYELLQQEILKRIGFLDTTLVPGVVTKPNFSIKWTGKIVNLSELVYGLFYTGQLNNGNVQLSEIVTLFEQMFSVKIRDVHHTFGEIKERKVSSPSKFIDSMATAIRQRVDDDLSYKPN